MILGAAACGGAQKGGTSYTAGAGAEMRCFEGGRAIDEKTNGPMMLKLTFDPANKKVVEQYSESGHPDKPGGILDWTVIWTVKEDGSATSSGGRSKDWQAGTASFTEGSAFHWTGWKTHGENTAGEIKLATDRTAKVDGEKLTYAEAAITDIPGVGPSTSQFSESYQAFDCAQYDAKRKAMPPQ